MYAPLFAYTCHDLRRVLPANCFQNIGNIQIAVALCCMLELIFLIIFYTPFFRGLIPYAFLIYFLVKIKICLVIPVPPSHPWREVGCFSWGRKSVLLRGTKSNIFFLTKVFIYNWHVSKSSQKTLIGFWWSVGEIKYFECVTSLSAYNGISPVIVFPFHS